MEEDVLNLLERWMNQNNISKEDQIKYYKKLIVKLEQEKTNIDRMLKKCVVSLSTMGLGAGIMLSPDQNLNIYLGILLIVFGGIVILPDQKKEKKEIDEIEEKRMLIKKWYIKEKE